LYFNKKIKTFILEKDNYKCQLCGQKGNHIHHIDYNKDNCSLNNLITLCRKCHPKTNWNRETWIALFTSGNYKIRKQPKVIFTCGSWDMLHIGHVNIFLKAKALGDYLIVGVSTDALIKSYKKMSPIISYNDRIAVIKALKCVDKVVKQTKLVDVKQFKKLKADIFVLGDDWKNNYTNEGINWLRKHNKIIFLPYTKHLSTSKIKETIIRNAVEIIQSQSKRR
jgi:glycerol-3-phosphate cytidylyltransferase